MALPTLSNGTSKPPGADPGLLGGRPDALAFRLLCHLFSVLSALDHWVWRLMAEMSAHSFGLCAYFLIGLLLRVGCEPLTAPLCLGLILTFVSRPG